MQQETEKELNSQIKKWGKTLRNEEAVIVEESQKQNWQNFCEQVCEFAITWGEDEWGNRTGEKSYFYNLLPIQEKGYLKSVVELYKKLGLKVQIIKDWENHDEYMSAIQGLLHFSQIALVNTLRKTTLDLKTMLSICSPIYSITFAVACRILMRNPELYMHILMDNTNNKPLLEKFITETKNQLKIIKNKDSKEFLKEFQISKDFLNPNRVKLKELGDFLIEMTQKKELVDR